MTKTIVNLTLPFIAKTIEQVLVAYPYQPYQAAFANPDMRESLIAYALRKVFSCYVAVEEDKKQQFMNSNPLQHCLEQAVDVEDIIKQGIEEILQEHSQKLEKQSLCLDTDAVLSPSNWFG
jgi:hypothetical protein